MLQAADFPDLRPLGEAVPQRFVILFEDAGSKADALATLPTHPNTGLVTSYSSLFHGAAVVATPALLGALIAGNPGVLAIEPDGVMHANGAQPLLYGAPAEPGLWGLDRIDQVCCRRLYYLSVRVRVRVRVRARVRVVRVCVLFFLCVYFSSALRTLECASGCSVDDLQSARAEERRFKLLLTTLFAPVRHRRLWRVTACSHTAT